MPMLHSEEDAEPLVFDGSIDCGPLPNLAALDEELTARIRRLVHQELAPIVKAEVEAEVERKLQARFPWLKAPEASLVNVTRLQQGLPEWAREDGK